MLWRLEFFVEGRHLEKALSSVAGIALNMAAPQPVTNVTKSKGGKLIQANPEVSKIQQLASSVKAFGKGKQIETPQIKKILVELGGSAQSTSNYAGQLLKMKIIKRKAQGLYVIL